MVSLLCGEGLHEAALRLEEYWDALAAREPFTLLCAYPLPRGTTAAEAHALARICGQHTRIVRPARTMAAAPETPVRVMTTLEQKARALEWEVQRRILVERSLAQRERELSEFLEHATQGLLKVGADGTVFWINRAGLELLGCGAEECIGRKVSEFHESPAEAAELLRRMSGGETLRNHAITLRRRDGALRHVRLSANALWDAGRMIHSRWFIRDVTPERLGEEARAHLAAIVESSDDAIVSKSLQGVIRTWNGAAERLFGYRADEAVGRHITLIIPPERVHEEEEILARLRRGERIDHFETVRLRKDGRAIPVSLTISPVRDASGAIVGASKIARDITERKRVEQAQLATIGELRRVQAALREADRRKDEFLAVLAHELRNPLAPIRYAVSMGRRPSGVTSEQRAHAQSIIERQVEHMGRLLDDLLDVSRITRGALTLRTSTVELAAVVAAAQEAARPLIESRSHTLSVHLPAQPLRLRADAVRLAQVLANLLINAAKYTEAGGHIELVAARDGDGLSLVVRDNGIGISRELMPRLFTLFAQGHPALESSDGGLGIGLALVRGLVELHGGTVGARSDGPGKGSEFTVRLPLGGVSGEPEPASPPRGGQESARLRVLVADDNRDSAESCAALLALNGHSVETAHTGREALELARRLEPDVLLLDIGMPELNGYEVAKRIRRTPYGARAKLIAISGWGQREDKRRALAAGFDHHLTKPIDPGTLEALLQAAAGSEEAPAHG
jgi:PAS domain S-box-containing protein